MPPVKLGSMKGLTAAVPGLLRRVRRERDLSQRDLAAALGVDQSRVARWETGESVPSLEVLERALGLGGLDLQVRDGAGEVARPLRPDAVRDRAGRFFPAHLDVREAPEPSRGELVVGAPWRAVRDARRRRGVAALLVPGAVQEVGVAVGRAGVAGEVGERMPAVGRPGVPDDHPTRGDLQAAREAAREARRRVRVEQAVSFRVSSEPEPACTCVDACFASPGCVVGCDCACEDRFTHGEDGWHRAA